MAPSLPPEGRRSRGPVVETARRAALGLGMAAIAGTLLSFRRSPHWVFRIWDFPRLQIAASAVISAVLYGASTSLGRPRDRAFLAALGLAVLLQARKIFVYTPLWPVQVERSDSPGRGNRFRLVVVNVRRENTSYRRVLDVIREHDPDLVLAVEIDGDWERALEALAEPYPHVVRQPQENHYGMMLFSRFRLDDSRVEFLVQDDVPSIHTTVVLPGGERLGLHGLHPRPPEPHRDRDTTARDAELVVVGRAIGEEAPDRPTVVAGDLNDVAWSRTTTRFRRLSNLLDPRIGRGFYNSYNANNPLLRWPLDHIFHSDHFRLVELRRLGNVGSDHFPMLVELSYEPDEGGEGPEQPARDTRHGEARLPEQPEISRAGEDRPRED